MERRLAHRFVTITCCLVLAGALSPSAAYAAKPEMPPTVTLTSPASGATYVSPATITLTANANDKAGGSVTKVAFYADATLIGTSTSAPFTTTWSNVAPDVYTLTAIATDNGGSTTRSSAVVITVNAAVVAVAANVAPTISMVSPSSGSVYTAPATISLGAKAADANGTIKRVDYYSGTTVIGSSTVAPYSATWVNVPAGTYTLAAWTIDNAGSWTVSSTVAVTVNAVGAPAANTPPTVSMTSPVSGTPYTAPATITLTAKAADANGTVTRVDYYNGSTMIGSSTTAPYSFAYPNIPAGTYTMMAVAFDNAGASTTSSPVTVTVNAAAAPAVNTPPTVSMTSPANGTAYTAPATMTLTAKAADANGTVTRVDYYNGATMIGSSTTAPYSLSFPNAPAGTYTMMAAAFDNAGASTTSSPVTVTVNAATAAAKALGGSDLGIYQFGKGWATFGLALPQGAAASGVIVGSLVTQTDIKTTWPDGSIRFAIVTAKIDTPGTYTITAGAPYAGSFSPTWPSASVKFVTGGQTYVATLPAFNGANSWLSDGPLVREARVLVTPAAGSPHPLLQVIFDVRSYSDGGHRVDVTVQNTRDITAGAEVTYDMTVTINGAAVFTKAGVAHQYLTRGRKVFNVNLTEAEVVPDFGPFYLAGAIPRFLPTVVNPTPVSTGAKFDLLGFGDMSLDMGAPGGRPEIAPYPNWIAQYLVHPANTALRAYMLASADLSGSWSGHITEADGTTLISLDNYPNYWLDGRAGTSPMGPNAKRTLHGGGEFVGGNDTGFWPLETAHHPSLTYVPYLVTGDRYYMDQMKFWSNFTMLATWDYGQRGGGQGILDGNQTRGIGWSLRSLADIAAYIPDADPMRGYFQGRLQNNLSYFDNMARTYNGGFANVLFVKDGFVATDKAVSLWQNSYVGWALDHAAQQGFGPVAAMRDRIVKLQVKFFNSDADGYPRSAGAPYYPTVMQKNAAGQWVFLTTMKQIRDASWAADPRDQPFAGYYGPEARMMLQIGVREGVPLAQPAMDYLMPYIVGDINYRSGWAVMP